MCYSNDITFIRSFLTIDHLVQKCARRATPRPARTPAHIHTKTAKSVCRPNFFRSWWKENTPEICYQAECMFNESGSGCIIGGGDVFNTSYAVCCKTAVHPVRPAERSEPAQTHLDVRLLRRLVACL
jgi:hypothetical protein